MERRVKERLIGAAVLVAAAVILIPEMLSGPERTEQAQATNVVRGAPALKTYTIQLEDRPTDSQQLPAPRIEDEPPPAESTAPEAARVDEAQTETPATATTPITQPVQPPPVAPSEKPAVRPAAEKTQPAPVASSPAVPNSKGWAVQIGSFSRQDRAELLAGELRRAGHAAFVMPTASGKAALYRVRVGPWPDREAAQRAVQALRAASPQAAVVAHP